MSFIGNIEHFSQGQAGNMERMEQLLAIFLTSIGAEYTILKDLLSSYLMELNQHYLITSIHD